jgi:hypothetical protein
MHELLSRRETANILGCNCVAVVRKIGGPCAVVFNGRREVSAWRTGRVLAYHAGQTIEPPPEPLEFFSLGECARRLECDRHKVRELMGQPDCLLVCGGGRELPCWSKQSVNAAFVLVSENRSAFDRVIPFRHRVSRKQRELSRWIAERIAARRQRTRPVRRISFCAPRHVWADPKAVAACRISR